MHSNPFRENTSGLMMQSDRHVWHSIDFYSNTIATTELALAL
ncbi:MAG: hypothetical protein AAF404_14765 [Pseudomonadota bacterium]